MNRPSSRTRGPFAIFALAAVLVTALATVLAVSGCGRGPEPPERVFLITIDTLRADHLGLYGYGRDVSPFLDSLGERGVVFERAYSSCSHTAPSHASLFTALHPAQHRVLQNGEELHDAALTIAEIYRDQGYATGAFTTVNFLRGLEAGYQTFENEQRFFPADHILGQALDWIRGHETDAKLFVWIHLFDVHQWYKPEQVDAEALAEIEALGEPLEMWAERRAERHGTSYTLHSPEKLRDAIDRYDAQILSTDRAIERFFQTLETEDLAENALWIVASDHGEGLGNHEYMGHGKTIYDEQIRVPLLVYFTDGRTAPRRVPGMVSLVDVAPTLAELVGASFDEQIIPPAGRSLLPWISGDPEARPARTTFAQRRPADERRLKEGWTPGDVYALQGPRYKVIRSTEGHIELFDLESDPFELVNRAGEDLAEKGQLLEGLERQITAMERQGELLGSGEINPAYVEELRALGYL